MSLIQEALRRKEADDRGVAPSPVAPLREPRKESPLKAVIAVLAVLLVLIGVAVYLFTYLVSSFSPKKPAPAVAAPAEVVVPVPVAAEETEPVPVAAHPVAEPAVAVETPEPVVEVNAPIVEVVQPEPMPEEEPKPTEWPNLSLTGVLRKGGPGGSAAAMISGELVSVNETIQGVRLVSVESSGVWLEMNGEQIFLTIGRSLK